MVIPDIVACRPQDLSAKEERLQRHEEEERRPGDQHRVVYSKNGFTKSIVRPQTKRLWLRRLLPHVDGNSDDGVSYA